MDKQWPLIKKRKKIKIFDLLNEHSDNDLKHIADGLLDNNIYISQQYPTVYIDIGQLWSSDPLHNRTWCYWLHVLIMIEYLVNAYERFNDQRYISKAVDFFLSWENSNCPESEIEMAWHDHVTALRLVLICRLFESWKTTADDTIALDIYNKFLDTIQVHCANLLNPNFYTFKHNHGIDQDRALYVAGIVFEYLPAAERWKKTALRRLKEQLNHLFLPDGSYLENTPLYSYIFCTRLLRFIHFLEHHNSSGYTLFKTEISKQLDFLAHIVQPDAFIPPIGDANPSRLSLKALKYMPTDTLQHIEYITSTGERGITPSALDKVFADGGYAAMRNQWNYDNATVQLLFYSTFHIKTHKHRDDLSILLFAHGQPLLTDMGKYNYNYERPERKYVVSSRAHNSVVVDDMDTNIRPPNVGKSGLTAYYLDKDFCYISGAHGLYQGIIHQRIVLYLKPWNILVMDNISGYKQHKFEQVFNFHPTVDCSLVNYKIIGKTKSGSKITLSPLLMPEGFESQLLNGVKEPLRGWCCLEYGKLLPSWSASYIARGKSTCFATHINLKPSQQPITHFSWEQSVINIATHEKNIEIITGESGNILTINNVEITINQVNNLNSILNGIIKNK